MKFFILLTAISFYSLTNVHANEFSAEDMTKIKDVLPTTYYIADEEKVSCKGMYRRINYDGTEVSQVLTPKGELIAEVCTRFFKVLSMEGTGILKDRGEGRITVNWGGNYRFVKMTKCKMGMGVGSYCLLPYHTIAADLEAHKPGTIIFIKRAKGLVLPDGSIHNGIFEVRDTGGAFRGIGPQRIDIFIANEDDDRNVFRAAGFHHRKGEEAYILSGQAKEDAILFLKNKFPELY